MLTISELTAIAKYPFPAGANLAVLFVDMITTVDRALSEILVRVDETGKGSFEASH